MLINVPDVLPRYFLLLKFSIIICTCIASAYCGYYYRSIVAERDMSVLIGRYTEEAKARSEAALSQREALSTKMAADAASSQKAIDGLKSDLKNLSDKRRSYVNANPLPNDCRPDSERVRQLNEAIDRANIAAAG